MLLMVVNFEKEVITHVPNFLVECIVGSETMLNYQRRQSVCVCVLGWGGG